MPARREFNRTSKSRAILRARDSGESYRNVGAAAGLSRARMIQNRPREVMDAFNQLQLEAERTMFVFYGVSEKPHSKLAHSLSEAIFDLRGNRVAVAAGGAYLVRDVFAEVNEDGAPVVHVELVPTSEEES